MCNYYFFVKHISPVTFVNKQEIILLPVLLFVYLGSFGKVSSAGEAGISFIFP
jgi:hypothetical protein